MYKEFELRNRFYVELCGWHRSRTEKCHHSQSNRRLALITQVAAPNSGVIVSIRYAINFGPGRAVIDFYISSTIIMQYGRTYCVIISRNSAAAVCVPSVVPSTAVHLSMKLHNERGKNAAAEKQISA